MHALPACAPLHSAEKTAMSHRPSPGAASDNGRHPPDPVLTAPRDFHPGNADYLHYLRHEFVSVPRASTTVQIAFPGYYAKQLCPPALSSNLFFLPPPKCLFQPSLSPHASLPGRLSVLHFLAAQRLRFPKAREVHETTLGSQTELGLILQTQSASTDG